jgi:hypothetical protein
MWYTYVLAASAIRPASRMGATPRPASGAVAVLPSPWGGAGGGAAAVASPVPLTQAVAVLPSPWGGAGGGAAAKGMRLPCETKPDACARWGCGGAPLHTRQANCDSAADER